ncbi:MAG: hypothetical protein L6R36_003944 [Xanthoria steineri]|nr:MAG: hypothetical protein L6R36_003944 [Xanthoria steineri]
MASPEHFRFLHLPFDVRIMILRYLLPNQHFILHEAYKADFDRLWAHSLLGNMDPPTWLTFDYNSMSPYPDILLANRQHESLLKELQPVPYHAIKEFILEIRCPYWDTTCEFRGLAIKLLRQFHDKKVHFRKLRIQFPYPQGPLRGWDHAWDSADPEARDWKPEHEVNRDDEDVTHQELTARDSGAPSTFAWFLSVFATCPSLADECIIELPESLRDKPHMQACAKRYAEGLDGRSSFHLEDECCLKQDLYDLHHENGYREDCNCEVCDVRTTSEWMGAVQERLLYSFHHRSARVRWIVRHHARGVWLSWIPRYHAMNEEDESECECGFCTCYRQHEHGERVLHARKLVRESDDIKEEDNDNNNLPPCQRPDHLRKRFTRRGSLDWGGALDAEREECEDCIELRAEELRAQGLSDDRCSDPDHVPQPVNSGLWRGLCEFRMSWKPKLNPISFRDDDYDDCKTCGGRMWLHPWLPRPEGWELPMYSGSSYCDDCLWESTGGWLGKNTLRASYFARWRFLGSMVWETVCLMVKDHMSSAWEDYTGMS